MKNKRLFLFLLAAAVILLIPLIAMLFTDEVNWSIFDFIVAGGLLFSTAILCDLVLRTVKKRWIRITACATLILLLLLIWAELAVGIF